jgi:CelD/BcsL family acetyltransferase involved in cellulose biosynthesis
MGHAATPRAASIEPLSRECWLEHARPFRDHNYRQAWAFAVACAERVGATSEHVAIRSGTELLGVSDVRVRILPWIRGGIAYVNGGPLVRRGGAGDLDNLSRALAALRAEYVERRGLVLRVRPALGEPGWNAETDRVFHEIGFSEPRVEEVYRTLRLDLTPPLEVLRQGLAQKWRNCLNKAERSDLELVSGTGPDLLERFSAAFRGFIARKGFDVDLDADFHGRVQEAHLPEERYVTTLAYHEGELAAGHVASYLGDTAVYLLGASEEAGRRTNASYALQWNAIVEARERGLIAYDLGGIDPEENPGVHRFKKGLGGAEASVAAYQLASRGLQGRLPLAAERLYRAVRGLAQGEARGAAR